MLYWLQFRSVQVFRMLKASGWGILAVLAIVSLPIWSRAFTFLSELEALHLSAGAFLAIGIFHGLRSDGRFLNSGSRPVRQYHIADYAGISILLALPALLSGASATIAAAFSGIIWGFVPSGFFRGGEKSGAALLFRNFPPGMFEMRTLLRRQWVIAILSFIILLPTYYHPGFYIGSIFIVFMMIPGTIEYLEPYSMLPVDTAAALRHWRQNARIIYGWWIPATLYLLAFHHNWWPLSLYALADMEILFALLMLYKYRVWAPDRKQIYGGGPLATTGVLAAIIPGGLIALVALLLWYGRGWRNLFK